MKIYFLAEWAKDRSRTWSGTCYGLYKALEKKTEIVDVNLNSNILIRIILRLYKRILCHDKSDMGLAKMMLYRYFYLLTNRGGKIFQFAEFVFDSKEQSTYIYQDLSASYVEYMAKNKQDVFAVSDYQDVPLSVIEKRSKIQTEYYQTCSGIFTMGRWLAKDLVERCGINEDKVFHVGGGINLNKELIDDTKKVGNKILFVGRNFKRKGGHMVYEAFCLLKKKRPDLELYIAGPSENPYPNNTQDGYFYMGDCSHDKLAYLFNKCDVFVMPSYFEAYGLVFIEALTFGLPCIGRDAYEMPYFIEDGVTGKLLKNDNPVELAGMMDDLLMNEKIKQNVRNKRDWYIKEYSWDSVTDRIIEHMK